VPTELPYQTRQEVHFAALDGLAKLKAARISTAMYTSTRTDVAIGYILDAAGWPAADRLLDTGKTTLARWWVDQIDAFTAIRDLVYTEGPGALFYVDASGKLVFESRHYRLLTARSTGSNATISGQGSEPVFGSSFEYEPGLRSIVNTCTVPVRAYASAAGVTIWTAPTLPLTLAPGQVRIFTVSATADGFSGATVVTLYLGPDVNRRLRPKLLSELRPGTRIVSHDFSLGDWTPERTIPVPQTPGHVVYLWHVPPR